MDDDGGRRSPRGNESPTLREQVRYRFDNLLARGTTATLIWLGAVTAAAVLVSSILLAVAGVAFSGSAEENWFEDVWQSLLRVLDPGTMAGDVGWGRRLLALLITIFGLLVAGTLIGIIAAGVEDRIEAMRRARSVVIESDHVVVLGFSDGLPVLLEQLVLAGESGEHRTIVVLGDVDPAELHAASRPASALSRGARIVSRSGDPTDLDDLALVGLPAARAVIVLSDRRSDDSAVETVLAVAATRGGFDGLTVVVELLESSTARRLQRAYGASIHASVTSDAVARTMAFALRQRGLGSVVAELLDFRGPDLHIVSDPRLVGTTFGEIVRRAARARPIGLIRPDGDGSHVELCPDFDSRVTSDDAIVMIGGDRRGVELIAPDHVRSVPSGSRRLPSPLETERLAVVRWNDLAAELLVGWATGADPASTVEVVVDPESVDIASIELPDLGPIPVRCTTTDDVIGQVARLDPTTVVVLASAGGRPGGTEGGTDVQTILDVNVLRRELGDRTDLAPRLVVELADAAHARLLDRAGPDDLVISDSMRGQFLAQLVDQPERRDVLLELYSADGALLHLVPCQELDLVGSHTCSDVVDRVAAAGSIVIGWRRAAERGGVVTLNPPSTSSVVLEAGDALIVVG